MTGPQRLEPLAPVSVGGAEVALWHLRLLGRPQDALTASLPDDDRARLRALPAEHAVRLLARRALLGELVAQHLGCTPQEVSWRRDDGVRSALGPSGRPVHVSVSSSGDRGLAAVADRPVGVDLEQDCAVPEASEVARVLLSAQERRWIEAGSRDGRGRGDAVTERFLRTWVRKEAVVKCTGTGLAGCDLQAFSVDASRTTAPVVDCAGRDLGVATAEVLVPGGVAAVAVTTAVR